MKKINKITNFILCMVFLACLSSFFSVMAHPGGTDNKGGHTDHSTGEYHYHHGEIAHDHIDTDGDMVLECPYEKRQLGGSYVINIVCFVALLAFVFVMLCVFIKIDRRKGFDFQIILRLLVLVFVLFFISVLVSVVIMSPLSWRASSVDTWLIILISPLISTAIWISILWVSSLIPPITRAIDNIIQQQKEVLSLTYHMVIISLLSIVISFWHLVW